MNKTYDRRQETYVCKICQRGSSPGSNPIVFCDDCNTPYHQLCHVPPIDRLVVDVADAQWFCKDCSAKRREVPLETGTSGESFSAQVKKTYLSSLSKAQLVEIIQYAETIDPKLPIYSPHTNSIALKMQLENNKRTFPTINGQSQLGYEDLMVDALAANTSKDEGADLQQIFKWIARDSESPETIDARFMQSATRALQRALRRGRVLKKGTKYYINYEYLPPSELSLSQYLAADDAALFAATAMKVPPPGDEDSYYCIDDNDEVFSHGVYVAVS